jgi:uncharacterized protein DUF6985
VFRATLDNFLGQGPTILDEATDALWAYYSSTVSHFSETERAEYGIPEIPPDSDIWDHVTFAFLPWIELGGTRLEPAPSYLSFEGEVSWEPEHGLQMVFEQGRRLCKVGPFDGHNTNAHAYDDESLLGVVFKD